MMLFSTLQDTLEEFNPTTTVLVINQLPQLAWEEAGSLLSLLCVRSPQLC